MHTEKAEPESSQRARFLGWEIIGPSCNKGKFSWGGGGGGGSRNLESP